MASEGDIATNSKTGRKAMFSGGQWHLLPEGSEPVSKPPPPNGMWEDLGRSIPGIGANVLSSLMSVHPKAIGDAVVGLPAQGVAWLASKFGVPHADEVLKELQAEPTMQQQAKAAIEKVTGELPEPQYALGKIANTAAQVAPFAYGSGLSGAGTALASLGSGVGSEVGEKVGGTPGRVIGELAGGALPFVPKPSFVKPAQALDQNRLAAGNRVAAEFPNAGITPGQITGDPVQLQREADAMANRWSPITAKALPSTQPQEFTQRIMRSAGYEHDATGNPIRSIQPQHLTEAEANLNNQLRGLEQRYGLQFDLQNPADPVARSVNKTVADAANFLPNKADRDLFEFWVDKIRNQYPSGQPMASADPAGLQGRSYVDLRTRLSEVANDPANKAVAPYLKQLRDALDEGMRASIAARDPSQLHAFDTIRQQRQQLKMLREPNVVEPTGYVSPERLRDAQLARAKRGALLDQDTQQLTQDVIGTGMGKPWPKPSSEGSARDVLGHLLHSGGAGGAVGGLMHLAGVGFPTNLYAALPAAAGAWAIPKVSRAVSAAREFTPAVQAARLGASPPANTDDMVRALLSQTPSLLNGP